MEQLGVALVKPTCRQVKGSLAAFYGAADKLREVYSKRLEEKDGAQRTFKLVLLADDGEPQSSAPEYLGD